MKATSWAVLATLAIASAQTVGCGSSTPGGSGRESNAERSAAVDTSILRFCSYNASGSGAGGPSSLWSISLARTVGNVTATYVRQPSPVGAPTGEVFSSETRSLVIHDNNVVQDDNMEIAKTRLRTEPAVWAALVGAGNTGVPAFAQMETAAVCKEGSAPSVDRTVAPTANCSYYFNPGKTFGLPTGTRFSVQQRTLGMAAVLDYTPVNGGADYPWTVTVQRTIDFHVANTVEQVRQSLLTPAMKTAETLLGSATQALPAISDRLKTCH